MSLPDDFPRRNRMDRWIPAEKAIYDAMQEVEKVGADIRLTDAVVLLDRAKDRVSDFVDGINFSGGASQPMNIIPGSCKGCGKPLLLMNLFMDDGCPCNMPRGVNFKPRPCSICGVDNCVKIAHHVHHLTTMYAVNG